MTIALIAHDSKKELMVQFCTAYCRILSQHKLVATGTTGKLISEATGLQVQRFLAGVQGGDQQIASRIACNESAASMRCSASFFAYFSSAGARYRASPDLRAPSHGSAPRR